MQKKHPPYPNKAFLMATLSGAAYQEPEDANKVFNKWGYPNHRFIDKDGAQCYVIWNDAHAIIIFRGTEPKELSDIKADLNAFQSKSKSKGDVHSGFQGEIDKVWNYLCFTLADISNREMHIT